jgi:hypothetical protein
LALFNTSGEKSQAKNLGNSPLERGAFSIVEMEEAGCVEMRIFELMPI